MLLLLPASAYAQQAPKFGLTFQMPTSAGILWRVNDRIAIRQDVRSSHSSSESTSTITIGSTTSTSSSQSSGYSIGASLSGLFYVSRWDTVRTYLSPRFDYVYSHSRFTSTGSTPSVTTNGTPSTSGSFGVQFDAHRHLSAFGELGLAYSTAGEPTTTGGQPGAVGGVGSSFTSSSRFWSMRIAFGAIVLF